MTAGRSSLPPGLSASYGSLLEHYDLLLVDLDGVVYLGDRPIDGAAGAFAAARRADVGLIFVTNNAARPPAEVAEQLAWMGVPVQPAEVMTSAIAAASDLANRLPAGTAVLVVGGDGIRDALVAAGLRPVTRAEDQPVAVLQGFGTEVDWSSLAEASVALRAGAQWVATNDDATFPSPRGPLPGNGSLVAALATATGLRPRVIGKPAPALFDAAIKAGGGDRPLMVGDRLDTDIAGARRIELPSLLVLTGVSGASDLLSAAPEERPNHVGRDLGALSLAHPRAECRDGVATSGAAQASMVRGKARLELADGQATPDDLDGLRALCTLAWSTASAKDSGKEGPAGFDAALATLDLD